MPGEGPLLVGPDHNDLAREDMPDTMRAKRDDCAGSPDAAPGCALPDRERDKLDALREVETRPNNINDLEPASLVRHVSTSQELRGCILSGMRGGCLNVPVFK